MAAPDILARYVLQGIQDQMDKRPFHDVVVNVKGQPFKCHRLLLSAASEYFRDKFSVEEKIDEVTLNDMMDPDVFKLVLEFIYKGKNMMSLSNVMDIWRAAHQLVIKYLEELCEIFLSKHLSNENIVDIFVNAKAMDNEKLRSMSWELIVKNFNDLRAEDDILRLDFVDLQKLISLDDLLVDDEDLIIGLILRWVQYEDTKTMSSKMAESGKDYEVLIKSTNAIEKMKEITDVSQIHPEDEGRLKKAIKDAGGFDDSDISSKESFSCEALGEKICERENYLSILLTSSKICLVSESCLQSLLENEMVHRNPQAFALVKQACGYKMQPWRTSDYVPSYATHRSTSDMVNVPIAIADKEEEVACVALMRDGSWKRLASPPKDLNDCKAVAYGSDIYATNSSGLGTMFRFSPDLNSWTQLPEMTTARINHGLVCHGSFLYAIGGDDCNTIERFNIRSGKSEPGQWKQVGVLKKKVSNIVVTSFGNAIIIFGTDSEGFHPEGSDCKDVTTIQCFDIDRNVSYNTVTTIDGPAKNLVCLRREGDTFILQGSGSLYKIRTCKKDCVELDFCGAIWDCDFGMLTAAVVFDQLVVLRSNVNTEIPDKWDTPEKELFKCVRVISMKKWLPQCLLNSAVPKTHLTEAIEEIEGEE